MINLKPKVSIFTTQWGHYSIAKAVEETLTDNNLDVKFNFIKSDQASERLYEAFYHVFPGLFKVPFKLGENKNIQKLIFQYLDNNYKSEILKMIKSQKPTYIINTYGGFNNILEKEVTNKKINLINIIPDPRTFHELAINNVGENFVFDKKAQKYVKKIKGVKVKTQISGWFVRKNFNYEYNKVSIRKKLELPENKFTIAVIGGSSGALNIIKTLPAIIKPPNPIHVIFICGKNKKLLSAINTFKNLIKRNKKSKLVISAFDFKPNIDEYIKASDLVLGKAGPNLLFETVACGVPFIAISHISGQEDGNIEIIKDYKLGFVEENQITLPLKLNMIIENPNILEGFKNTLKEMADYNKKSGEVLMNALNS